MAVEASGLTVTDDSGQAIELARPATRIIALYGAFNEMLAAMGRENLLVARTNADDQPESILAKPSIGTHMRPNLELVVGLRPDLALQVAGRGEAGETTAALRRLGVPTATFRLESLEDVYSVIERLGALTGSEPQAADLAASMRARLDRVARAVAQDPASPRVFFEARYPNLLAAGARSIVSDIIRAAGGVNCVESQAKLVRLSEEELVRLDPEVYLLQRGAMNPDPSSPAERPHFRTIRAVREGRVVVVDEDVFSRPGPRVVEAVETLAAVLHPGVFPPKTQEPVSVRPVSVGPVSVGPGAVREVAQ